jgi:hypothetical protein
MAFGEAARRIQSIRTLAVELAGIGKLQQVAKPSLLGGGDRRGNGKNSENPNLIMGRRIVRPKKNVTRGVLEKPIGKTQQALSITERAGNTHSVTNSALGAPTVGYAGLAAARSRSGLAWGEGGTTVVKNLATFVPKSENGGVPRLCA